MPTAAGRSARQSSGGRYRPSVPHRLPRRIPDGRFNDIFAALRHDRDRALLAFWVSNGARASELLTSRQRDPLPGEQLLGVIRKGTAAFQQLPSLPYAFGCYCCTSTKHGGPAFPGVGTRRCGGRCVSRFGRSYTTPRGLC